MKERTLLIFGSDETRKFDDLPKNQFKEITISGGHHYGDNFDALSNGIISAAKE
jgi:type IV secretory pathway VirJ component